MKSDGQVLHDAVRASLWSILDDWEHTSEAQRIGWEEAAARVELHFAERTRGKLGGMARS